MSQQEARVLMSADDSQVARAWQRQFQNFERATSAIEKLGRASADAGNKSDAAWLRLPSTLNHTIELGRKLIEVMNQANQAEQRFNKERAIGAFSEDVLKRELAREMGVAPDSKELSTAWTQILKQSIDRGAGTQLAAKLATDLADQNFSGNLFGPGGALESLLRWKSAAGRGPQDLENDLASFKRELMAENKPLNDKELARVINRRYAIDQRFKFADDANTLSESLASLVSLGRTVEDSIAELAVIADHTSAPKAVKMMAGYAKAALAVQGLDPTATKNAMALGLTPEDFTKGPIHVFNKAGAFVESAGNKQVALNQFHELFGQGAYSRFALQRGAEEVAKAKASIAGASVYQGSAMRDQGIEFEKRRAEAAREQAVSADDKPSHAQVFKTNIEAMLISKKVTQSVRDNIMALYDASIAAGADPKTAMDQAIYFGNSTSSAWSAYASIWPSDWLNRITGDARVARRAYLDYNREETKRQEEHDKLFEVTPAIKVKLQVGQREVEGRAEHPAAAFNSQGQPTPLWQMLFQSGPRR